MLQSNAGTRIVPEWPDNSYIILGTPLRFRVLGDVNIKVVADGVTLPRQAQQTATSGWYEPTGTALTGGSRGFFWDIAVKLPASALAAGNKNFPIDFIYDTVTTAAQPQLRVTLRLQGRDPNYVASHPRPSEVFVGNSDNTKDDNRMETAIVAEQVTLAGWLIDPHRNDGTSGGTTGSEDWKYEIYLDPDFIRPITAHLISVEPLQSAALPGNVVPLIRGAATPIPLVGSNARPDVGAFLLAGSGIFGVELNAWHTWARGSRPTSWVSDPDSTQYQGNAGFITR